MKPKSETSMHQPTGSDRRFSLPMQKMEPCFPRHSHDGSNPEHSFEFELHSESFHHGNVCEVNELLNQTNKSQRCFQGVESENSLKIKHDHLVLDYDLEERASHAEENEELTGEDNNMPLATNNRTRKRIKNKHVKATIMIAGIWSIMIAFIVVSLSVDWWAPKTSPSLCTLCGNDPNEYIGTDMNLTDWPTRMPSSNEGESHAAILANSNILRPPPPPENIAQVCAPSIYLNNGNDSIGLWSNDLFTVCANSCFPALCCIASNEEAKRGFLQALVSQGLAPQTSSYLLSLKDCYKDDNIMTCDEYNKWCRTLYMLDEAIDHTIPMQMEESCVMHSNETLMEISRSSNSYDMRDDCSWKCSPLSCCYANSSKTIRRKRIRQPISFATTAGGFQNASLPISCQGFIAPKDSLNAKICNAYAPFCNPQYVSLFTASPVETNPVSPTSNPTFAPTKKSDFNVSHNSTTSLPSFEPTSTSYPSTNSKFHHNYQNTTSSIFSMVPSGQHGATQIPSPTGKSQSTPLLSSQQPQDETMQPPTPNAHYFFATGDSSVGNNQSTAG